MPVLCTDAPADGTVGASETEATTGVDCSKDDTDAVVPEGDPAGKCPRKGTRNYVVCSVT